MTSRSLTTFRSDVGWHPESGRNFTLAEQRYETYLKERAEEQEDEL